MDVVLQASGRNRRHRRAADGSLLAPDAADGREPLPVLVLSPAPDDNLTTRWYKDLFDAPGADLVAGNLAEVWRTAVLLRDRREIAYGSERALLDAATDPNAVATPADIATADGKALTKEDRRRGIAQLALARGLSHVDGYLFCTLPTDDREDAFATRMDDLHSVECTVVEEKDDGRLVPFTAGEEDEQE